MRCQWTHPCSPLLAIWNTSSRLVRLLHLFELVLCRFFTPRPACPDEAAGAACKGRASGAGMVPARLHGTRLKACAISAHTSPSAPPHHAAAMRQGKWATCQGLASWCRQRLRCTCVSRRMPGRCLHTCQHGRFCIRAQAKIMQGRQCAGTAALACPPAPCWREVERATHALATHRSSGRQMPAPVQGNTPDISSMACCALHEYSHQYCPGAKSVDHAVPRTSCHHSHLRS